MRRMPAVRKAPLTITGRCRRELPKHQERREGAGPVIARQPVPHRRDKVPQPAPRKRGTMWSSGGGQ